MTESEDDHDCDSSKNDHQRPRIKIYLLSKLRYMVYLNSCQRPKVNNN